MAEYLPICNTNIHFQKSWLKWEKTSVLFYNPTTPLGRNGLTRTWNGASSLDWKKHLLFIISLRWLRLGLAIWPGQCHGLFWKTLEKKDKKEEIKVKPEELHCSGCIWNRFYGKELHQLLSFQQSKQSYHKPCTWDECLWMTCSLFLLFYLNFSLRKKI